MCNLWTLTSNQNLNVYSSERWNNEEKAHIINKRGRCTEHTVLLTPLQEAGRSFSSSRDRVMAPWPFRGFTLRGVFEQCEAAVLFLLLRIFFHEAGESQRGERKCSTVMWFLICIFFLFFVAYVFMCLHEDSHNASCVGSRAAEARARATGRHARLGRHGDPTHHPLRALPPSQKQHNTMFYSVGCVLAAAQNKCNFNKVSVRGRYGASGGKIKAS